MLRPEIMRADYVEQLRNRDRQSRDGLWAASVHRLAAAAEQGAERLGKALLNWVESRRFAVSGQDI